jgi:predicted metal-dependent hydrolase
MLNHLMIAGIAVTVQQKKIKHVHLKVLPPDGMVQVSAPHHVSLRAIKELLGEKVGWIKAQQQRLADQPREEPKRYVSGESHLYQGQPYRLKVVPHLGRGHIEIEGEQTLRMSAAPTLNAAARQALLATWYRQQLQVQLDQLVPLKVQQMPVPMPAYRIKKMKTRWGTCNTRAQRIWLNLELIKMPPLCLEYVVVHELTHLLEPSHNHRFQALMTRFMPDWQRVQQQLDNTRLG